MVGDALSVKLSGNIVVEGYIFSTENPRKLKLKIKNIKRPAGYSDIADQYAANVLVDKITSNGYIEVEANSKIISIGQAKFDSVMENLDIL